MAYLKRLLVASLAAVVLVGCGNRGSEVSSEPILDAAEATLAAGSAAIEQHVTVEGSTLVPDGTEITSIATATFAEPKALHGTFDFGLEIGTFEMILSGTRLYVRGDAITILTGTPDVWMFADLDADTQFAANYEQVAEENDGSLLLAYLYGVDDHAERIGTRSIDGVGVTGYRTIVSMSAAVMEAPFAERDELRANLSEMLGGGVSTELDAEIWIDGDGFVRRAVYVYDLGDGSITSAVDLSEFGEHPTVEVPPASQVIDIADVESA